jgi:hypothetical protein
MSYWVPLGAWIGAAVVALVVLGFCAYEIVWKARRLQGDLRKLQALNDQIAELRVQVTAAQQRVAASGLR